MLGCLRALDDALRERGSGLVVRHGDPARELLALADETGAQAVLWTSDVAPYARARDRRVTEALARGRRAGAPAGRLVRRRRLQAAHAGGQAVHRLQPVSPPLARARAAHRAPRARRAAGAPEQAAQGSPAGRRRSRPAAAASSRSRFASPASRPLARRSRAGSTGRSTPMPTRTTCSRSTARAGCRRTCAGAACRPPSASSARRAAAATGASAWIRQLCWREFYAHVLLTHPDNARHEFQPRYRELEWHDDRRRARRLARGPHGLSARRRRHAPARAARAGCTTARGWLSDRF